MGAQVTLNLLLSLYTKDEMEDILQVSNCNCYVVIPHGDVTLTWLTALQTNITGDLRSGSSSVVTQAMRLHALISLRRLSATQTPEVESTRMY